MASAKNSNRSKRKYGEGQKARTLKNKAKKKIHEERRLASLVNRTQSLIGQHVAVRVKDHPKPMIGTVLEVISKDNPDYPHEAKRHHGRYLRVRTAIGEMLASRHRVKPVKDRK